MFKNAFIYRIEHWAAPVPSKIDEALAAAPFAECGATEPESAGWLPPRGNLQAAYVETIAGQWLLRLGSEAKQVPSGVVKRMLAERLSRIEADTGRRPRGKAAREMKEALVHELLPRAFAKRSETMVWIDPDGRWLLVGVATAKKADAVLSRLAEAFGSGLKLAPWQTRLSAATAMAMWLREREAPTGFSIDRDCELKAPDGEKPAVRYARHTLDIDEVGRHIGEGKQPTRLALTWRSRVSLVLTDAGALKGIKLLDELLEGRPRHDDDGEDAFDADAALFTGEMRLLLGELADALGGLKDEAAEPALPAAADGTAPWDEPVAA